MFSDIKELEREITQFRSNLQEGEKFGDSLRKIQVYLSEIQERLNHDSLEILTCLKDTQDACSALKKEVPEEIQRNVEQVGEYLEKQKEAAQEQAQSLTEAQKAALETLQVKAAQTLTENTQEAVSKVDQAVKTLEASQEKSGEMQESLLAQFRSGVEAIQADLEKQKETAREQVQSLTENQKATLEDIQTKAAQALQQENQTCIGEFQQSIEKLKTEQAQQLSAWKQEAERLTAFVDQNVKAQNEQVLTLLNKIDAMDLSTVNNRIGKLRMLIFFAMGLSACTLIAAILNLILK